MVRKEKKEEKDENEDEEEEEWCHMPSSRRFVALGRANLAALPPARKVEAPPPRRGGWKELVMSG